MSLGRINVVTRISRETMSITLSAFTSFRDNFYQFFELLLPIFRTTFTSFWTIFTTADKIFPTGIIPTLKWFAIIEEKIVNLEHFVLISYSYICHYILLLIIITFLFVYFVRESEH